MAKLQVKGPRSGDSGPVHYRTMFSRSASQEATGLLVSFRLGDKLRHGETGNEDEKQHSKNVISPPLESSKDPKTEIDHQLFSMPPDSALTSPSTANDSPPNEPGQMAQDNDAKFENDSDIEIIEVRPSASKKIPRRRVIGSGSSRSNSSVSSDDSGANTEGELSSELSALDSQINEVLSPNSEVSSQALYYNRQASKLSLPAGNIPPIHNLLPEFYKPHTIVKGPPPPGYRNIPPNLVYAITRELNIWMETSADDDVEMVNKLSFTLKDPIIKTKIRLPVKSSTCRHFECFDFNTFCDFHDLKPGVRSMLRTSLVQQSSEARAAENLFLIQQQRIAAGAIDPDSPKIIYPYFSEHGQMFFTKLYSRTAPLYKCPLCDEKFGLKQLYISDIFNFFVKTTPLHITKVQLEGARYRIIEEDAQEEFKDEAEIVDLSEDEEVESKDVDGQEKGVVEGAESHANGESSLNLEAEGTRNTDINKSMTADDFNDGLDEVLMNMSKGDGSWDHPLTLD